MRESRVWSDPLSCFLRERGGDCDGYGEPLAYINPKLNIFILSVGALYFTPPRYHPIQSTYSLRCNISLRRHYSMLYVKVLPLDEELTASVLGPLAGFTLEMKRKPAKYAFLYFIPSGHIFSLIKLVFIKFGIETMTASNARSLCSCV